MSDTLDDDVEQLGIVLETADPERAWNAFRLGITALEDGLDVSVFLLGEGVETEEITDDEITGDGFDVRERMEAFDDAGGELLACGTCLEIRKRDGSEVCPISTMSDLLEVVTTSDRVLTVG
ncbi:DsrE family protein [Halorubrum rubrum]|uniref:DsrE family protein n=1 Tax=Halorubrum rubrum TaxID=1126240 RepID=A0ABD5R4R2_9EURY|nr:DsrE family protein [Halorubrum rubrum]